MLSAKKDSYASIDLTTPYAILNTMYIFKMQYSILFRAIALFVACLFLANDISWAVPSSYSNYLETTTTLAVESRLKPFFEKHGLDFQNMFSVYCVTAELRNLIMKREVRDSDIVRLNRNLPQDEIQIERETVKSKFIKAASFESTGKDYKYAILNFKKSGKRIKMAFVDSKLESSERLELGIKTENDIDHFSSPGLEGVWFINIKPSSNFGSGNAAQTIYEMLSSYGDKEDILSDHGKRVLACIRDGSVSSDILGFDINKLRGSTLPQAIEQLVLPVEHGGLNNGKNSFFISPEEYLEKNPQWASSRFSIFPKSIRLVKGCNNDCLFCLAEGRRSVQSLPYPIAAQRILRTHFKRDGMRGRARAVAYYHGDEDIFHYIDKICGANIADLISFEQKFPSPVRFYTEMYTAGYSPFDPSMAYVKDAIGQLRGQKINERTYRIFITYHLFRPEIEEAILQKDKGKLIRAVRAYMRMYKELFLCQPGLEVLNRSALEEDANSSRVIKTIAAIQAQVLKHLKNEDETKEASPVFYDRCINWTRGHKAKSEFERLRKAESEDPELTAFLDSLVIEEIVAGWGAPPNAGPESPAQKGMSTHDTPSIDTGKLIEANEALSRVENYLRSDKIVIFGDMHRGELKPQDDEVWDRELFLDYVEQMGKLSMNFSVALELPYQLEDKLNDPSVSVEEFLDEYYKLIANEYSDEITRINSEIRGPYLYRLLTALKHFKIPVILIGDINGQLNGGFTTIDRIEQSNEDMTRKLLEGRKKYSNDSVLVMVGRNHVVPKVNPIWLGGREINSIPEMLRESATNVKLIRPDDIQHDEEDLAKFDLVIKVDGERQNEYLARQKDMSMRDASPIDRNGLSSLLFTRNRDGEIFLNIPVFEKIVNSVHSSRVLGSARYLSDLEGFVPLSKCKNDIDIMLFNQIGAKDKSAIIAKLVTELEKYGIVKIGQNGESVTVRFPGSEENAVLHITDQWNLNTIIYDIVRYQGNCLSMLQKIREGDIGPSLSDKTVKIYLSVSYYFGDPELYRSRLREFLDCKNEHEFEKLKDIIFRQDLDTLAERMHSLLDEEKLGVVRERINMKEPLESSRMGTNSALDLTALVNKLVEEISSKQAPEWMAQAYRPGRVLVSAEREGNDTIDAKIKQAKQHIMLATQDPILQARAEQALELLRRHPRVPELMILEFEGVAHRLIKLITGNEQAYQEYKRKLDEAIQPLYLQIRDQILKIPDRKEALRTAVIYAGIVNLLDITHAASIQEIADGLGVKIDFSKGLPSPTDIQYVLNKVYEYVVNEKAIIIDELEDFLARLEKNPPGGTILYFTDNHGEFTFDQLVIEQLLLAGYKVAVVSRGETVRDDVTRDEATTLLKANPNFRAFFADGRLTVTTDGSYFLGADLNQSTQHPDFLAAWRQSVGYISKGAGNFHTLFGQRLSLPGLYIRMMKKSQNSYQLLEEARGLTFSKKTPYDLALVYQPEVSSNGVSPRPGWAPLAGTDESTISRYGFQGKLIATDLDGLFEKIGDMVAEKDGRLLAVDGLASAGKTTLVKGNNALQVKGLKTYLENRFGRPVICLERDWFLKSREERKAVCAHLHPDEIFTEEAETHFDNEAYVQKLTEVLEFLNTKGPPGETYQLKGKAYNWISEKVDADLSDMGYVPPIPRNAIVIVEGQHTLAKTNPGFFDVKVFVDVADTGKTLERAVQKEMGRDEVRRRSADDIRKRMRQVDIPSSRALQERGNYMEHMDFVVMNDDLSRPLIYQSMGGDALLKANEGDVSLPISGKISPAGSIYSVFEYLCEHNITDKYHAISGNILAKAVGEEHVVRQKALSPKSIERDLRALLRLRLIKKGPRIGTAKDAPYYVPEAVKKKAYRILPVLEQFRGRDLRPTIPRLDDVYKNQILPILTESDIGSATLAFRLMNALTYADVKEDFNVMVTYKCPFNCSHCLAKDALRVGKGKDAEKGQLFALFDQLKGFKRIHIVGPGEPLAYGKDKLLKPGISKDFLEVIRYAAERIEEIRIVTNGYLFPEDIDEARRFFAQFPKNILWQLSVDKFHEEQFARMPGRDKDSLQRVVKVMEQLAEEGLIKTAYIARIEPGESSRNLIGYFDLESKYYSDYKSIFINKVVAQGSAIANIATAKPLDNEDVRNHGFVPSKLFPFIDTEGNFVTSDHVAYMTGNQRKELSKKIPKRAMVVGNINSSPLGKIIADRLIFGNYKDWIYIEELDRVTFKDVVRALILYQNGDKKTAMSTMLSLFRKSIESPKEILKITHHLTDRLKDISLINFIEDCENNGITIIERQGKNKIDLAMAVGIFQKRTDVYRDFAEAFAEEYEAEESKIPLLYFYGPCPIYGVSSGYFQFRNDNERFFSGRDRGFYISMRTGSPDVIEERFIKDMELAADGIVHHPVGALYDKRDRNYHYVVVEENGVDVDDATEINEFVSEAVLVNYHKDSKIGWNIKKIGEFAAKLDKHNVSITANDCRRYNTMLLQRNNGDIMLWGHYTVKRDPWAPSAKDMFNELFHETLERAFSPKDNRLKYLMKIVDTNFIKGYNSEFNKGGIVRSKDIMPQPLLVSVQEEASKIHAENLEHTPAIPDKTIICHIIAGSILPAGQRNVLKTLEQNMRDEKYSEKVVSLSVEDSGSPEEFMKELEIIKAREEAKYPGYKVQFDVACPDKDLVSAIQDKGMRALAFAKEGDGDIVQVEGIILALRALQTGSIDNLIKVYKLLTGKEFSPGTNDINELARMMLFILPVRKVDLNALSALNKIIEENIKTAA
ncbi:MAG: ARMT1-like domain-containing protein [Candidatus Omnitrophica bacterium]|nr:ARMT1-like domain-containing protein [Candidatus Omnitrophota bacterium]